MLNLKVVALFTMAALLVARVFWILSGDPLPLIYLMDFVLAPIISVGLAIIKNWCHKTDAETERIEWLKKGWGEPDSYELPGGRSFSTAMMSAVSIMIVDLLHLYNIPPVY